MTNANHLALVKSLASLYASDARADFSRSFVTVVLRNLWNEHCRRIEYKLPITRPWVPSTPLPSEAHSAAARFGVDLTALPLLAALHEVGLIYTSAMEPKERTRVGAYYTPPALCAALVDMAESQGVDFATASVIDPASGGGAILAAVATRMSELLSRSPRQAFEQISTNLRGFEIDPFSAWISQVATELITLPISKRVKERLPTLVEVCDSLQQVSSDCRKFDLVIGNPPYGRVRLDAYQRVQFAQSLHGHANLYGLFTHAALLWCKHAGHIAYVTPTSFLGGQYFKNLRALLAAEAPPRQFCFVEARKNVFDSVLQETMLSIFRRGSPKGLIKVSHVRDEDAERGVTVDGASALPNSPSAPWRIPRRQSSVPLLERANQLGSRLAEYGYRISTGPLVWNRHKAQFRGAAEERTYPVVWAESVQSNGVFQWSASRRNHLPWFAPTEREYWTITRTGCVLVQRTTAKEQSRRLIAAELPDSFVAQHRGVVVENHLNMVVPVTRLSKVSPSLIAVLLNHPILDELFRCINGSVAVSAFELGSLPVPSLQDAIAMDRMISAGVPQVVIDAEITAIYEGRSALVAATA